MSRTPLRILCFGDSLTAGWPSMDPYAGKLEEKLEKALSHIEVRCEVDGEPGDEVARGSYQRRMQKAWDRCHPHPHRAARQGQGQGQGQRQQQQRRRQSDSESQRKAAEGDGGEQRDHDEGEGEGEGDRDDKNHPSRRCYDWTVVLGGTNDIAWSAPAEAVVEGLRRTWDVALSRGGRVLALTIPEVKHDSPATRGKRDQINEFIRTYKRHDYFHFDLFSALPYNAMPPAQRSRIWEPDGVHLTSEGYRFMGERIAEALAQIVRLAEAQDTEISSVVSDARQRRAIEGLIFEEERGDHRLLSQGYIVVRKRDLD
ncbi:hypothetical protein DL766_009536 [Monosporascus sp. MC13-8B]|uniref:SGNH hydrolase-type esterase domain-containing protein n=1 Tax=Monosporascus cannonballus TaxID=155416 RepID=A0ABY0H219_9PEZI|nr:hypothetical protein DL763_009601 [Monosporascus cannonballus]RYO82788.1 hypothetical protein DL762_006452 [Monosporascus cannonballus]RYP14941.1 hypothetical protein DL766_009536 [Monosporascus sp. MC13-8B]